MAFEPLTLVLTPHTPVQRPTAAAPSNTHLNAWRGRAPSASWPTPQQV